MPADFYRLISAESAELAFRSQISNLQSQIDILLAHLPEKPPPQSATAERGGYPSTITGTAVPPAGRYIRSLGRESQEPVSIIRSPAPNGGDIA